MSKRRIGLHDVGYERLSEAEKRVPHPPSEMRSGNSRCVPQMWVCFEHRCGEVQYTYAPPHTPPICEGGMQWSYTTDGEYRRGVHKFWVGGNL